MDTSETPGPSASGQDHSQSSQQVHDVHNRLANRNDAKETGLSRGIFSERREVWTVMEERPSEFPGRPPGPVESPPKVYQGPSLVIEEAVLQDIALQIATHLDDQSWITFGYSLKFSPHTLELLQRRYTNNVEKTFELLKLWAQRQTLSSDEAMRYLINALQETEVHQLADRLSTLYKVPPRGTYSEDISLSTRGSHSSDDQTNISSTNEARVVVPEPELPSQNPATTTAQLTEGAFSRTVASSRTQVATAPSEDIVPSYKMNANPRGICVIINNERFYKDPGDAGAREMPNREGTHVDAENLFRTFERLSFVVHRYDNLKSHEMVRVLVSISINTNHEEYDCFVCCVLSHGTQGHVYGVDGRLVNITDFTGPFKSVACPSLAGKPKLFFLQACQGREKQLGQEIERDSAEPEEDGVPREVIPNEADFLIGYATVPGFVSYRSRSHGSWYVTKLCEMLNKHGTKIDLLSVLLLVNSEVGRANAMMDGGRYKQSPAPLYTLRKQLKFS